MEDKIQIIVGRDVEDTIKYGTKGTINIGKHIVGTGEDAHFTTPVLMDILRPHLMILCGKRGSGKSYSIGVFVEEMMKLPDEFRKSLCSVIIDTQGIFWTMKQANEKDIISLNKWGMKSIGFPIAVYVPEGQKIIFEKAGVDFDGIFSVAAHEITGDDWLAVFQLSQNESLGIFLQKIINDMKGEFTIDDIIKQIESEKGFESEKMALVNRFSVAKNWGIFGESKMPKLLEPGKASVIDVSLTSQNVRSLLISLISKKIFSERTIARRKEELAETEGYSIKRTPMCWIMIDEAHNFISSDQKNASQDILLRIVKEGRQPGIGLLLATQRPEKLHPDALAQSDLLVSHMLTSKADIDSLRAVMQTYMLFDITKYLIDLPKMKGVAIVMDDNSERIYSVYIRPRQSWHAGSSPVAKM
ncbi:MAG: ATP-binding protein [Candidatus Aenigmatarchaeota archaeon]